MPARAKSQDYSVVLDLDELLTKPVGFQVLGRTYTVRPVSTETFLKLANVLGEIQALIKSIGEGAEAHDVQIYEAYHRYISVLCPEFTLDTLKKMQLPQVHGLVNLIIKHATGQPMNLDVVEKKKMLNRLGT